MMRHDAMRQALQRLPLYTMGAVALLAVAAVGARGQEAPPPPMAPGDGLVPFVLPWNDASPGLTNMSGLFDKPAGARGPVVAKDGHFYVGENRIRFFGVNLCFGASFPTHEQAEAIAARMARFGINCVRFHHMDTSPSPAGLVKADGKTIDPERLERLDYLIAQLKEQGIYSNLNLHVGRMYPDRPRWQGQPSYFKGIDNVDSAMIRDQMQFAKELLEHVNPYTKARYADEPAVAIVEINNENALYNEWWGTGLDEMPDPYSADLRKRWNAYLKEAYPSDAALREAWGIEDHPRGAEMLSNGGFDRDAQGWNFEQHSGQARHEVEGSRLVLTVEEPAREAWHIQFNQAGLALDESMPYTLRFRARASEPFRLAVSAMQAHEPWRSLWSTQLPVTTEWQDYEVVFRPSQADERSRVGFSGLGSKAIRFELDDVSLAPGGLMGLKEGEALGSIPWFRKRDFDSRTPQAQRDWIRFLWKLEDRYWTGMYRYIKTTLGVKGVVLGTQMGWSPAFIQAQLDAIDSHAYWQHPHFPNRPWDGNDWLINNIPMAGRRDGGTLPRLGLSRVFGKPFLCTEYNHSAPNTYGSEGFLLLAAYAARQDWDAIFPFAYSHRGDHDWSPERITSFFDIDQHPTKMATLPAAAAIFLRGDVAPARPIASAQPTADQWLEAGRTQGAWSLGGEAFGLTTEQALTQRVGLVLDDVAAAEAQQTPAGADQARADDDAKAFAWKPGADDLTGVVTIDTPRSKAVIGSIRSGPFVLENVTISFGANRQDWAALTLTAIDGPDFRSPGRLLITATGDVGNLGMQWRDAAKTTIGNRWGQAPSLVEVIPASIELPLPASRVKVWPLDETGQRRTNSPLEVKDSGSGSLFSIGGPGANTIWYEVEIAE